MIVICDWECTCIKNKNISFQNEIIEMAAIKCDDNFNVISEFDMFVTPILNPILSDFCKELTSIKQTDIDNAKLFPFVLYEFNKWLKETENNIFHSWGNFDKNQLIKDCQLHNEEYPFDERHINLKKVVAKKLKVKPKGMQPMMEYLKIPLIGIHHRGIDDCKNIARICQYTKI